MIFLSPSRVDPDRVELLQLVADGDDDVGVVEAEVDVVVPHEPDRAEGVGWSSGNTPLPWKVLATGRPSFSEKRTQGVGRAGPGGAVAGQHDRAAAARSTAARPRDLRRRRRVGADTLTRQRAQAVRRLVGLDVSGTAR